MANPIKPDKLKFDDPKLHCKHQSKSTGSFEVTNNTDAPKGHIVIIDSTVGTGQTQRLWAGHVSVANGTTRKFVVSCIRGGYMKKEDAPSIKADESVTVTVISPEDPPAISNPSDPPTVMQID